MHKYFANEASTCSQQQDFINNIHNHKHTHAHNYNKQINPLSFVLYNYYLLCHTCQLSRTLSTILNILVDTQIYICTICSNINGNMFTYIHMYAHRYTFAIQRQTHINYAQEDNLKLLQVVLPYWRTFSAQRIHHNAVRFFKLHFSSQGFKFSALSTEIKKVLDDKNQTVISLQKVMAKSTFFATTWDQYNYIIDLGCTLSIRSIQMGILFDETCKLLNSKKNNWAFFNIILKNVIQVIITLFKNTANNQTLLYRMEMLCIYTQVYINQQTCVCIYLQIQSNPSNPNRINFQSSSDLSGSSDFQNQFS
eukprot:TRINITY_DN6560_c0_g2_i9.p1 TRINITY_DN6560_c0_g2~~TRINITY_DN6560_c0_g2_i9.p1  ORF type:complete len:308 (-),score=-19.04 TRINITY_DN6560_c0_g2_i9:80-1003(-)